MLCPQKEQGKSTTDSWPLELDLQTQESTHRILFRTAKAETAGKTKTFHVAPDFRTEKRNHSQLFPEKKMEK